MEKENSLEDSCQREVRWLGPGSSGSGKRLLNCRCGLKVQSAGFVDGLEVGCERRKGPWLPANILTCNTGRMELLFTEMGTTGRRADRGSMGEFISSVSTYCVKYVFDLLVKVSISNNSRHSK